MDNHFDELSKHYKFDVFFCAPGRPNQKGHVENGVKVIKQALRSSYINSFQDLDEVQDFVNNLFKISNKKMHPSKNDTCKRLFQHEKALLNKLPKRQYTYYMKKKRTVYRDNKISFKNSRYSVSEGYQGQRIIIRFNESMLYAISNEGDILAKHPLAKKKKSRIYRVWHMLNKLKMKSKGFEYSEEYRSMPKWLKMLYIKTFSRDVNIFIEFLQSVQGMKKDFLKICLRRNKLTFSELTIELLMIEVARL